MATTALWSLANVRAATGALILAVARSRRLALLAAALLVILGTVVAPDDVAAATAHRMKAAVHPTGAELHRFPTKLQHHIDRPPPPSLVAPEQGGSKAVDPIDLRVLVVSADGNETDFPAIKAFLNQIGLPYNTLIATQTPLTASMLWDGASHGYYSGIILATGNLTYFNPSTGQWQSAFNDAQWQTLWQYEALFGIRQVTSYTDPIGYPDTYGLQLVTSQDTTTTPLQASLTIAGQGVYSYLNSSTPLTFRNAWVYLATIQDPATTTPLLQTSTGYAIASIHSYPDGRQNLAVTAANNPNLTHSLLLSYGTINWVTKGLFFGARHAQLDTTVDDLFIDDNVWDPATLTDIANIYRINAGDLQAMLNWQASVQAANPNTAAFRVEMAFNGVGTEPGQYNPDTLTPAVAANQSQLNFLNHTYTHFNLDNPNTPPGTFIDELQRNENVAQQIPFTNYWHDAFVQPDISGLTNPTFHQTAYSWGIRYMISDTSQPGWNNPSPNAGFWSQYQPGLLIIPRHPTNLFYNLATPDQWVSEYNCYYGPRGTCANGAWRFWDHNLSYSEILDVESNFMLSYLLKWDVDPIMFHQTNLFAYDGAHSLFSDLMDAVFAKYNIMYSLPIVDHPEHQIGIDMAQRMAYNASGVTGSLVPCRSLTVGTVNAAVIPVTGVTSGPPGTVFENYGGQSIAYLNLSAGQSVTVPVSC